MTQFKRTGGGQAEKQGGVTNVVDSRPLPDQRHSIFVTFKSRKWNRYSVSGQPFPHTWDVGRDRLRLPHVWNIQPGYRRWVIRWRGTVAETGVCTYARERVCMCQHKRVSHRRMLAAADSQRSSANLWRRPNPPAVHLFPSSISKTTLLSLYIRWELWHPFHWMAIDIFFLWTYHQFVVIQTNKTWKMICF